ncbi:oligoendopeptidase F [Desulfolucanica intricata]|uniref:oligoendopeptidase F n=1 Tax=Desulfolucanica intricata TaxID=1285191 RepID=UPI00082F5001|nr:oligoendopeptidase F [Desulfolucanica intricata]
MSELSKEKYTWDLSAIYRSGEEWEETLKNIPQLVSQITEMKGNITISAQNLLNTLNTVEKLSISLARAYSFARLSFDTNMGDSISKNRYERIDSIATQVNEQLAFIEPELLKMDENKFQIYKNEEPELNKYSFKFEKLFRMKKHILSPEMEELMTKLDSLGRSFKKVFDDLVVNDLTFPDVTGESEKKIEANEANYLKCLTSQDRVLRENYFKGLLNTYGSHQNSIASIYYGSVKHDIFEANTRKYNSSRDMALTSNFIPVEVYDNLINTVRNNVDKLQQYLNLRKKALGLDEIHFYDLFVPVVKDLSKSYSFEEAKDLVLDALAVLGNDYTDILKRAFDERWIDVYPAKGKRSGAYAIGIYGSHPYSLLNFTGNLEDVFTLAHELGHVMHSYYSNENQPYINSQYSIFTAEVASTVNETLLFNHLLSKINSPEEKANLLSMHLDSLRSTLYRQTFFADFEKQVHELVEKDQPLIPDILGSLYKKLYELYYGKDFVTDEELSYEWARIPHFYTAFYVYQYSTGISAAISIAKRIQNEGEPALAGYKDFLKSGGSDYPINLLKKAGVDMSSPQPILDAIKDFEQSVQQLSSILGISV